MVAMQTDVHCTPKQVPADVLDLFCRALEEVNRLERRPIGSSVEYVMRLWRPQLDLPALGFADIEDLAAAAERQGLIRQATVSGQRLLQRRIAAAAPPAAAEYHAFIEHKLRCPLPPPAARQRIYAMTYAVLAERSRESAPLSLVELSYRVAGRLGGCAGQHSVFKLLFAMVLSNALIFIPHERAHDIRVTSPAALPEHWDALFAATCIAGLRRDRPEWPLDPDALSRIFGLPPATIHALVQNHP